MKIFSILKFIKYITLVNNNIISFALFLKIIATLHHYIFFDIPNNYNLLYLQLEIDDDAVKHNNMNVEYNDYFKSYYFIYKILFNVKNNNYNLVIVIIESNENNIELKKTLFILVNEYNKLNNYNIQEGIVYNIKSYVLKLYIFYIKDKNIIELEIPLDIANIILTNKFNSEINCYICSNKIIKYENINEENQNIKAQNTINKNEHIKSNLKYIKVKREIIKYKSYIKKLRLILLGSTVLMVISGMVVIHLILKI